jgi:hypothetical protein
MQCLRRLAWEYEDSFDVNSWNILLDISVANGDPGRQFGKCSDRCHREKAIAFIMADTTPDSTEVVMEPTSLIIAAHPMQYDCRLDLPKTQQP